MIGIKVQNLVWEKALLELLNSQAEKYQKNHTYDAVISDSNLNDFPTLILGKDISLPFCFSQLKEKLTHIQESHFENDIFKWISQTRQLIRKKDKNVIQLTEKESEIIGFLARCPKHKATKEEILQSVWHYQNDIHTHTVESHIYALRQKLAPHADQLIIAQDSTYKLI